jgi:hypothetical protein
VDRGVLGRCDRECGPYAWRSCERISCELYELMVIEAREYEGHVYRMDMEISECKPRGRWNG